MFGEKPEYIKSEKENIWLIIPPFISLLMLLYLSLFLPVFMGVLLNNVALN